MLIYFYFNTDEVKELSTCTSYPDDICPAFDKSNKQHNLKKCSCFYLIFIMF